MGLLKHLLFWPVTGPSFLTRFSLAKVEGAVRTELTDDSSVKRDLMELQMQLELGDIDDEEYVERELEIMYRLRQVRQWRERYGMPTSGGLVQVADDARADDSPTADTGPDERSREGRPPSVARSDDAEIGIVLGFDED